MRLAGMALARSGQRVVKWVSESRSVSGLKVPMPSDNIRNADPLLALALSRRRPRRRARSRAPAQTPTHRPRAPRLDLNVVLLRWRRLQL